jgi:hypothetical protein
MNSLMILWLTLAGAGALLGVVTCVVLFFTKPTNKHSLSGGAISVWAGALIIGAVAIAAFTSGASPYNSGPESRMNLLFSGLGQFLGATVVGFIAAGLTGFLPIGKRPNLISTTLVLTTIVLSVSAIGQLII